MPESSPAACLLAMRATAAWRPLLSLLRKVDSALTLVSFSGRDDSDDFFTMLILPPVDVHYQQHRRLNASDCVPPLLALNYPILPQDQARIFKNQRGRLEVERVVFAPLLLVLRSVPFKPNRYTNRIALYPECLRT
jgi:hypothetical protein